MCVKVCLQLCPTSDAEECTTFCDVGESLFIGEHTVGVDDRELLVTKPLDEVECFVLLVGYGEDDDINIINTWKLALYVNVEFFPEIDEGVMTDDVCAFFLSGGQECSRGGVTCVTYILSITDTEKKNLFPLQWGVEERFDGVKCDDGHGLVLFDGLHTKGKVERFVEEVL